jgi:outer membrane protein OmpA-like peptidoglycan-associated protein
MFNFLDGKDPTFIPKIQAMKKFITPLLLALSFTAFGQLTPTFELGAGLALKHTEGFYIPRYTVSAINLYKGLGVYTTYEQRNEVSFVDDFNGDGNYQRYTMGPTLSLNQNLYAFAGVSPLGPYGFTGEGGFGKVRKEVGLGLVFNPITLRLGYSNWVGTTIGVHYRFGSNPDALSFQGRKSRKSQTSGLAIARKQPEPQIIERVDTVIVKEEVVKEVVKEVVREVEKPTELTQIAVLYFEFNTTSYTRESQLQLEALADALKTYPSEAVVIIGHTDEVGTDAYNYTLGLNRAQKVANFLVNTRGIAPNRIEVLSEGLASPSETNTPDKNRRVIVYVKK